MGLLNEIYVKPGSTTSLSLGLAGQSELRLKGRKRKCQHREGHFLSPPEQGLGRRISPSSVLRPQDRISRGIADQTLPY